MGEFLLAAGILLFGLVVWWAWRKHVKREPRSLQQSFDDFLREERSRRTERG